MSTELVGPSLRSRPYSVGLEKLREFAAAFGGDDPIHHDEEAARASGLPAVVATPTFSMAIFGPALERFIGELGVRREGDAVLHSSQRFSYHRPLYAGDHVVCEVRLAERRKRGADTVFGIVGEVSSTDGEPIVTIHTTLMIRHGAA